MSKKYFKEYFWRYPQVVITEVKTKRLVFDEDVFFSETEKYLHGYFSDSRIANSHFVAFRAYLVNEVNVSPIAEKVNTVMQLMSERIISGNVVLNENTRFTFSGNRAKEALWGVFVAYHETSLLNGRCGRFDVYGRPLFYDPDNLVIRLIYYKKDSVITKILKKDPPVEKEEILESNKIKDITGDSNAMTISLIDEKALLEVTPYTTRWLNPQLP